jgi:hypothetical protein
VGSAGCGIATTREDRCADNEEAKKLPAVGYERDAVRRLENDIEVCGGDVRPARARRASNETESAINAELVSAASSGNKFETQVGNRKTPMWRD